MPELLLALDVGTTSLGAGVFSPDGKLLAWSSRRLKTKSPAPGHLARDAGRDARGPDSGGPKRGRPGRHRDHHPAHQRHDLGWARRPTADAARAVERPSRDRAGDEPAQRRLFRRPTAGGGQAGGRRRQRGAGPSRLGQHRQLSDLAPQRRRGARHRPQPGLAHRLPRPLDHGLEPGADRPSGPGRGDVPAPGRHLGPDRRDHRRRTWPAGPDLR
jgi:hypothetical protein